MMRLLVASAILATALAAPGAQFVEYSDSLRDSVRKANRWLLKAQNRDGSWGLDAQSPGDLTCTALAGLALLADGTTERDGNEAERIQALRKAAEFLLDKARKARNDIANGQNTLIQGKLGATVHNHFAVVFFSQLYGMRSGDLSDDLNTQLRETLAKYTHFISKTQESDGSWHKETFGSLKATCMAWLALRASAGTGVTIEGAALDKTLRFIQKSYDPKTRLFYLQGGYGHGLSYQTLYATSSAVRVLLGSGLGEEKMALDAIDEFIKQVKSGSWNQMFLSVEGEDFLAAMMMTHALVGENGPRWRAWWPLIRERLLKRQNADGSWTTTACISGRTFATACAILSLETPNRLLPIQE